MNDILKSLIKQFMPFAQQHIGFKNPPKLFLRQDSENAANPLGKTAFYDPQKMSITLYTSDRHPKDILRSLGHELVHHKQNCDGKFDNIEEMGEGYAQTNPHLRKMEEEANMWGSMCLRDFEDTLKRDNTIYFEHLQKGDTNMSTKDWKNGELKSLLSEAWGFNMDLSKLNENVNEEVNEEAGAFAPNHYCVHHGGVSHNGSVQMAEAISHNWNEQLGKVTHYDMKLKDGTILENVAVEDIQITDASLAEGHGSHPAKRDHEDEELDEGEKPDFLDLDKDGNKNEPMTDAADDADETVDEQSKSDLPDRGGNRSQGGRRLDEEDEEVVEEDFPGKRDMDQHKSDLSEARLKEIIAYALNTKG
jgi:hypothetical protein